MSLALWEVRLQHMHYCHIRQALTPQHSGQRLHEAFKRKHGAVLRVRYARSSGACCNSASQRSSVLHKWSCQKFCLLVTLSCLVASFELQADAASQGSTEGARFRPNLAADSKADVLSTVNIAKDLAHRSSNATPTAGWAQVSVAGLLDPSLQAGRCMLAVFVTCSATLCNSLVPAHAMPGYAVPC